MLRGKPVKSLNLLTSRACGEKLILESLRPQVLQVFDPAKK